jgi:hypothetical protein
MAFWRALFVTEALAVIGLFLVRLGVPLLLTLAVAHALRRLDAGWQAEAEGELRVAELNAVQLAELKALQGNQRCWEVKGCSEERRAECPGCGPLDIPCWVARLRATGRLPVQCHDCELFAPSLRG